MTDLGTVPMHKSKVLANLDQFRINDASVTKTGLMRSMLDMFLMWQVIQHFGPRQFFEIGFAAGQSMGIMYEASGQKGRYVSVDKDYRDRNIFDGVFPGHAVLFNEQDSADLELDPDQQFDFVHIDGDHSYEMVRNDLNKIWPSMHERTILYMDDYRVPGVDQAIQHEILAKTDFRPFLYGDQSVFFHHQGQPKDVFVDDVLQQRSCNFVYYANEDLYHRPVLRARLPNVFVDHPQIFIDALRAYDL